MKANAEHSSTANPAHSEYNLDKLLNIHPLPPELRPPSFEEGIRTRAITVEDLIGRDVMQGIVAKEKAARIEARRASRRPTLASTAIRRHA
jgi:hypothetical protein